MTNLDPAEIRSQIIAEFGLLLTTLGLPQSQMQRAMATLRALSERPATTPIDMVLFCPACGVQHIDAPEGGQEAQPDGTSHFEAAWTNPPHRSHLCHDCGHVWRPADVPTNGVAAIKTRGREDSALALEAPARDGVTTCPVCFAAHQVQGGDDYARIGLLEWAVGRWRAEVQHRPLVNINRRPLDDAWRQVIRHAGGNPDELVGPSHDALVDARGLLR